MAKNKQTQLSPKELAEFREYQKKKKQERIKNHKPTIYGYARVSTREQNYDSQIKDLIQHGVDQKNIFKEKYTGTTTKRPQFQKLLKLLLPGDTLTVTKLDRLARNLKEAIDTMQYFQDHGIILYVLNIGHIDNTDSGKLIFAVFSAFAEFERNLIISRTTEGRKWAREHNPDYRDGRPNKYSQSRILLAYRLHYGDKYSLKQTSKQTDIPVATMCRRFSMLTDKEKQQALNAATKENKN